MPDNPHDVVPLTLELPTVTDPSLQERQRRVLEHLGLELDHSLCMTRLSPRLLGTLRVVVATPEELDSVDNGQDPIAGPLNRENESQTLRTLDVALASLLDPLEACPLMERGVEETAVRPEAPTNENGLDHQWVASREMCRLYVQGQRKILHSAQEQVRMLLTAL